MQRYDFFSNIGEKDFAVPATARQKKNPAEAPVRTGTCMCVPVLQETQTEGCHERVLKRKNI